MANIIGLKRVKERLCNVFQDAIKANSFYSYDASITCGDVENALQQADNVIEGEYHIGGQEHFYMETQGTIAIPKEDKEIELHVSTQNATGTQVTGNI